MALRVVVGGECMERFVVYPVRRWGRRCCTARVALVSFSLVDSAIIVPFPLVLTPVSTNAAHVLLATSAA